MDSTLQIKIGNVKAKLGLRQLAGAFAGETHKLLQNQGHKPRYGKKYGSVGDYKSYGFDFAEFIPNLSGEVRERVTQAKELVLLVRGDGQGNKKRLLSSNKNITDKSFIY